MPEIITMALFCAALIGCIATGISIIPALVAGLAIFLVHGRLTGHTWGAMIRKHGVATVAPFSLLVPIFGMSFSALALGETFGPSRLPGAALVVCGLIFTVLGPRLVARRQARAVQAS